MYDLPLVPTKIADSTEDVANADRRARFWEFPEPGSAAPGSDMHFRMFTALLGATYNPYKPAVLDWPLLEPDTRRRITGLPIWDIAVQTENKAAARIAFYAQTVSRPVLREALLHMAGEEARHREVLSRLVAAYDIPMKPEPYYALPNDAEWGWLVTGFSECIDSFFAYGLFEMAKRSGYFPDKLVETFEPVVQEEGRHILFFANWLAWHRARLTWWKRPGFELKIWAVWVFLIWERIGIAKDVDGLEGADANFTMNGSSAISEGMDLPQLLAICLEEDKRRMAGYDSRLKRPSTVPFLGRIGLTFLRLKSRITGR
ncbi:MAG: ferritin-like domain-containing protein [Rhodospirillales bacterium]|nr:ferritin-like domain-containing protein [Rhodospirillales bacterium]MDE2318329.1 ferritin-like domain-containing protein [Rhodospirillales bacterium]